MRGEQKIDRAIYIEDLVNLLPESVNYLMKKNIRCIVCGDPIWGTLEEAAREKGYSDEQIDQIVQDLNTMLKEKEATEKQT